MLTTLTPSWQRDLRDFARAVSGAFMFAIPLLYTMEMWWIGTYAELWKIFLLLVVTVVLNLGLNALSGFQRKQSRLATVEQTLDAVAVGLVTATVVLLVLDRIEPSDPLDSIVGKIVLQAVPLSIGASVANAIFRGRAQGETRSGRAGEEPSTARLLAEDIGATVIGGVFIGFSVAPTEEIAMLAAELDGTHQLALIGLTLLLSYTVVFASGFQAQITAAPFQRPATETVLTYFVSLVVAVLVLFFFDAVHPGDPPTVIITQALVLGLPVCIGGAAGRLVI